MMILLFFSQGFAEGSFDEYSDDFIITDEFTKSGRFISSATPSFPPSDDPLQSEKEVTLIVIVSVFSVVGIVLTVMCCVKRTQIQKAEGPMRPVRSALVEQDPGPVASSEPGVLLPGRLKYAQFDI
jgi:hypothetical protein